MEKIALSALNFEGVARGRTARSATVEPLPAFRVRDRIGKEELIGENRSAQYHAMAVSDRSEAGGRRGRDLPFQCKLAAWWLTQGLCTLMNWKRRIVISKTEASTCAMAREAPTGR